MISNDKAESFAHEWLEAWNSHDLERILSHYAEGVEFNSPLVEKRMGLPEGTVNGKAALADYFRRGLASFPGLSFEFLHVLAGVNSVTVVYRGVLGVLAAETMVFDEQGKIARGIAHYGGPA